MWQNLRMAEIRFGNSEATTANPIVIGGDENLVRMFAFRNILFILPRKPFGYFISCIQKSYIVEVISLFVLNS